MGIVKAVCVGKSRGEGKKPAKHANFIANFGIESDAHAGSGHRQVSLMSYEKILEVRGQDIVIENESFAENLIVEGMDFKALTVGSRLFCNGVLMEITQVGQECREDCVMQHDKDKTCEHHHSGIYAKVIEGGIILPDDKISVREPSIFRPLTVAVITLGDRGLKSEKTDQCASVIKQYLEEHGYEVIEMLELSDNQEQIEAALIRLADTRQADLILTAGGMGISVRDCVPEATLKVATRNAPGIAEAIRYGSMQITKRAMLSRGVSVLRGQTLIVNLPGTPRAVQDSLDIILEELKNGLEILRSGVR